MITKANKVVTRLKEPSSMAGIAALAVVLGMPTDVVNAAVQVVVGVAGLLAVVLPESSK